MYWLTVALLVILNIITALWAATEIRRERREYRKEEAGRKAPRQDRYKKRDERPEVREKERKKSAPYISGKRRWKVVLKDISAGEVSDHIFCDSLGIGRAAASEGFEEFYSIPDNRRISKIHCSIRPERDCLYLNDEGSTNSTFLNGKKIKGPEILKKGDVISIGGTDISVVKIFREAL